MTSTISSKQVVQKPETMLDPNFFLPPGVVDARYVTDDDPTTEDQDFPSDDDVEFSQQGDVILDGGIGEVPSNSGALLPPDTVVVVSQTIRQSPDGRSVVDVVIDVQDVPGTAQYDLKVTKV